MPNGWLNVPHFRQEFNYSCVAACVRMVMAHYGRNESEVDILRPPKGFGLRSITRMIR